jgi:hypothetical protein
MLVYNTATAGVSPNNVVPGFYYWNGSKWIPIGKAGWELTGNDISATPTYFLGTTSSNDLIIKTNNTEKLRVLSGGNVGIGITTPNYLLHLHSTADPVNLLQLTNTNTGTTATDGFKINLSSGKIEFNNQESAGMSFFTSGTERVSILSDGKVGINVLAPSEKLDVGGNVKFSNALMPNNLPGSSGQVLVSQGAGTAPVWQNIGNTWQTYTAAATRTLINNGSGFDATDNGFIQIGGLTKTFTTTASNTMLLIFTYGALETTSSSYGGSGTRTKVFYNGASITGAEATLDIEDGSGWVNTIVEFSIMTFKTVGPGTHTIDVRSKKYNNYDNFTAGGSYTGLQNEGSLVIMAIPQ